MSDTKRSDAGHSHPDPRRRGLLRGGAAAGAGIAGLAAAGTLGGCALVPGQPRGPADTIVTNARIATMNRRRPWASTIAIRGDTILEVGDHDVMRFASQQTRIIDAGKRVVIPGLNDAHSHFVRGGLGYAGEVRWDHLTSLADALALLRAQAARTPAPHWVNVIGGWSPQQFAERRLPSIEEINAVSADVPVLVMHIYDRLWLNRAALRVLGWDAKTPDMPGGHLVRDAKGNPTGEVVARTTLAALVGIVLRIPRLSDEEQMLSTRHFMRELNRLGMTSTIDAGGGGQFFPKDYQAILELDRRRQLTLRIGYLLFGQSVGKELDDYRAWAQMVKPGQGNDLLRMIGGGEYLTWASADVANFDYDFKGQPAMMESQLFEVMKFIVERQWPFRIHTVYNESSTRVLDVIEKLDRELPVGRLRWGLEHCELISPRNLERVAALGGSIGIQNRLSVGTQAFVRRFGKEAGLDAPPLRRMLEMGVPVAAGTDGNRANSHNPWLSLHWLVTGGDAGGTRLMHERNRLDRMEALRLWTQNGAWFSFEEDRKGTLEAGRWADLAILSADYFGVAEAEIPRLESVLTMVGGAIVHASGPYAKHAPAPLPVTPSWLPVAHHRTAAAFSPVLAAAPRALGHDHPLIIGERGPWSFECGCGLV
jgi:predicted amidohydrolase YtcJ